MNRKRIIFAATGVLALGVAAYYVAGRRAQSEVDRLIGQAHGRGIKTDMNAILLGPHGGGRAEFRELAGIDSERSLRDLKFAAENVAKARGLIASADQYFAPIAEFANLERYAPRSFYDSATTFDDYVTIAAAAQLEGWRGYLLAEDGRFADALTSVEVLKGLMGRLHDENVPIGNAVAYAKAQRWACRVALRLAEQSENATEIGKIQKAIATLPKNDFKGGLSWLLAGDLAYLDEVEMGKYEVEPPSQILNFQFRFAKTGAYLDAVRAATLKLVIQSYDTWDTAPLDILGDRIFTSEPGNFEGNLVNSTASSIAWQRRAERNDLTDRRAIALALLAHKHRALTGAFPTVEQLEAQGLNVNDPWDGNQLTLHAEGDTLWIGALRPDRKAVDAKPQVVDVLNWRP